MLKRLIGWVSLFVITVCCVFASSLDTYAETLQSPNYKLDESVIGVGDLNQSSSASYKAVNATGDIAIGNSASQNYQVEAGSQTTHDPTLSFKVINGNVDFGRFSATDPATTTTTFSVSNYTSYGYVVLITGDPPTNQSHTINAMAATDSSQTGKEQFGINLVANTSPVSFGANPDNGQFGFGSVESDYSTANRFRYVSGETIAHADKSSGMTTYTISYLVNVSSITPGGKYTSDQTVIITGTY